VTREPEYEQLSLDLSGHDWVDVDWHGRRAQACGRCGYVWKPDMPRPTKDCGDVLP
jgi:hypothetical protein